MKQTSFASAEYAGKKRKTRREKFLSEMDAVVPWARLEALIEPHHPRSGKVGRPPIGVPRMLRMYCLQQWYTLADEALEDARYDSQAMRELVGVDLSCEDVPDTTTLVKFRRLLEQHELTAAILAEVNAHLSERGLAVRQRSAGSEWDDGDGIDTPGERPDDGSFRRAVGIAALAACPH